MKRVLSAFTYVLIALPLLVGAGLLLSVRTWIVDPQFYKDNLTGSRFEEVINSAEFPGSFPKDIEIQGVHFNGPALAETLRSEIPMSILRPALQYVIDTWFEDLNNPKPEGAVRVSISLKEAKSWLLEHKTNFLTTYLSKLPQEGAATSASLIAGNNLAVRPSDVSGARAVAALSPVVVSLVSGIPDVYTFEDKKGDLNELPSLKTATFSPLRGLVEYGTIWVGVLAVAFLSLSVFIRNRSLPDILRSYGSGFLFPSIIILGAGVVLQVLAGPMAQGLVLNKAPSIHMLDNWPAMADWVRSLAAQTSQGFLITGGTGAALAVSLLIAQFTLRRSLRRLEADDDFDKDE